MVFKFALKFIKRRDTFRKLGLIDQKYGNAILDWIFQTANLGDQIITLEAKRTARQRANQNLQ